MRTQVPSLRTLAVLGALFWRFMQVSVLEVKKKSCPRAALEGLDLEVFIAPLPVGYCVCRHFQFP